MPIALPAFCTTQRQEILPGPNDLLWRMLVAAKGIEEFVLHYHVERNHQGLGSRLIMPGECQTDQVGGERLGSMLNYYYRAAA
jgi:hypothetical protein